MRRAILIAAVLLPGIASETRAGDGRQIFDLFVNQLDRQISRQQQRQFEKQQRQQNDQLLQSFLAAWNACFNGLDVAPCDTALGHYGVPPQDQTRLYRRRAEIIEFHNRQEAEGAAAFERQQRAEREHQRAEAERERLANEAEAQRQAAQRAYDADLNSCGNFDVAACNRGLTSPLATATDKANMHDWRSSAQTYAAYKDACRAGSTDACKSAEGSPAISEGDRSQIAEWRANATPVAKAAAVLSTAGSQAIETGSIAASTARGLPLSTQIMSAIAALLAITLAMQLRRRNTVPPPSASEGAASLRSPHQPPELSNVLLRATPSDAMPGNLQPPPIPGAQTLSSAEPPAEGSTVLVIVEPPKLEPAPCPIDTPAALRALKLAHSYLQETASTGHSEPDAARSMRTTLSLASRQMDIAHKADPNAKLETEEGLRISQAHLRARILCQEALSWSLENLSKAAALAGHATLADPAFADAFHVLGALHYENRNRAGAITALTKAHELDPDNIETCKLLDRAQNMGVSEVATFKVAKAGVTVANTGIKVYNAGVHTRNVFVFFWNVFAAIINVVTLPVRLMDRIFGARR